MSEIPIPKDERHRKFADLVLDGIPAASAYRQAGFTAKNAATASASSARLLRNASICKYLEAMRQRAVLAVGFDKERAVKMAVDILNSKPSEASMENPLCEVRWTAEGPVPVFPSKAKMMDRVAKMLGFDAPEKVEVDGVQELAQALANMRNEAAGRE